MAKPALMTVDDDSDVLHAVERDLRRRYADRYRVLAADSGPAALQILDRLKERHETVALLLADQRMPVMPGVELLGEVLKRYPAAKRVLLTAYADTDAAISAINLARIDYYLLKPWDPPEQNLYPVLDDLLEVWLAGYQPPYDGLRVLGQRWSPLSYQMREFLGRHQVPFQWIDVEAKETNQEARALLDQVTAEGLVLPVIVFPDGARLSQPKPGELAEKLGLRMRAETSFYDLVIVGAGPAGLAAAVYGASEGLKTLLIDREAPGGQAGLSSRIENYLGFPSGLSGADLARRAVVQARRFGVELLAPQEAESLCANGPYRILKLADGSEVSAHSVLISTGLAWRKLAVSGMDRLQGAGVYYGSAMTEAFDCRGEDVYIVGGANSAGQAAVFFSQFARTVTMLVRAASLAKSMSQYLIDQINAIPNIKVETETEVTSVDGASNLESITIRNRATGETRTAPATGLFVFIGAVPQTAWLKGVLPMDDRGYVLSGPQLAGDGLEPKPWTQTRQPFLLESGMPGVFVAGDVRHNSIKRVASAVGEGSIAVQMVHQYLSNVK